ncbi:MAG: hypothetical protein AB7F09_09855 [Parvibaculaceae bacterium]
MVLMQDVFEPLGLAGRLLLRYWPQLLLLAVIGSLLHDLLLEAAVRAGMDNALLGMVILSLVVLAKLAVIVMMFSVVRPALAGLAALDQTKAGTSSPAEHRGDHILAVTAAAILPFFVYYAAWGFLGDTVREYSRIALSRVPFGESAHFLDLLQARWLVASIVLCWLIRWFAKYMNKRAGVPYWRFLVVACDATWLFIGLYGIGIYKDQLIEKLGAGAFAAWSFIGEAQAAETFRPVEFTPLGFWADLQNLFFFALLPLVWLVMAAIINGYEVVGAGKPVAETVATASSWRRWLGDFIGHFLGGYRSRYAPVWKCVRLTFAAGPATLLTLVIAYQAVSWAGAWLWVGITRWIGAADLVTWQMLASPITIFIGSPSDLDGGILLDAVRICLLAAVLDHAVSSGTRRNDEISAARGRLA